MAHKFVYNVDQLERFLGLLKDFIKQEKDDVFFLCLMSRNKYLTDEERKTVDLSRANVVTRFILHDLELPTIMRYLSRMESTEGSYLDRSGNPLPDIALVPYITINPVSPILAFQETQRIFVEQLLELDNRSGDKSNTYDRLSRIDQTFMTNLHHAFARRSVLDIDMDVPHETEGVVSRYSKLFRDTYSVRNFVVKTRSGFHLLLKKQDIKFNYQKVIDEMEKELRVLSAHTGYNPTRIEVAVNNNQAIPLPGCRQRDFDIEIKE